MKLNLLKALVLLLSIVLFACGGGSETETNSDTDAGEESTETTTEDATSETSDSESSDENTSSDLPEAGQGITFYAKQYEEAFLADKIMPDIEVQREYDDVAGYAKIAWSPGMAGETVELGLWVTTDNREIIGVFSSIYGGMSEGGEPANLKFYATNWEEITAEVVNITELEELSQSVRATGDINKFMAKIPQSGTSIQLSDSKEGKKVELGELQFDLESGQFTLVKK